MSRVDDAAAKMIANLKEKTGKSLEQWVAIVQKEKLEKHSAIVKWLKTEKDFTHGYANLVAHKTLKSDAGSSTSPDLIEAQYKGKEHLKPIYNKLLESINSFGTDIELAPKKAYMSVRRNRQFAIIQPSTKTRVDLGIKLKDVDPQGVLLKAGSWNTMVSHRVKLTDANEVTKEVIGWLKSAYEQAG